MSNTKKDCQQNEHSEYELTPNKINSMVLCDKDFLN